jgi:hypothetical protein
VRIINISFSTSVVEMQTYRRRGVLIKKQKYFGNTGMLMMLAFISAFPPLSTDLYLPALPKMMAALDSSQSYVNMTLSLFFIFFADGFCSATNPL